MDTSRSFSSLFGNKRDLRIIVDTCSWMHEQAKTALEGFLIPLVRQIGRGIVIPLQVVNEVQRLQSSPKSTTRKEAQRAYELIKHYQAAGLAEIFRGSDTTFADNVIQMVITRFCEQYHFCLITQDRALAADVLALGQRRSVQGKSVFAFRINRHGDIARWELHPERGATWRSVNPIHSRPKGQPPRGDTRPTGPPGNKFRLCTGKPRRCNDPLEVTEMPGVGSRIVDDAGNFVTLVKQIGSGGEGLVFLTDRDLVCKIYTDRRLTIGTRDKIKLMLQKPVQYPGICWPRSSARNQKGEFVGYLMDRAEGKELQRCVFIKPLLQERFPAWTRLNLTKLAICILKRVLYLHEGNILLGDINPMNILVVDDETLFFVDTDSYQIEDFACPVGTPTFLARDLFGKDLSSVLRTFDHEHFAVATLLFMILMPGKPPYSHAGGGDPAQNVRARHFPYPLGEKKGEGVPAGPWRFMWSHLPFYLKEKFHEVFSKGALPTTEDWLKLMGRYFNDLSEGYVSSEIYPTGFKQLSREQVEEKGGRWVECENCGKGFGEFRADKGDTTLCPECRNREISKRCVLCGNDFSMRFLELRKLGNRPPICHGCRSQVYMHCCTQCGTSFSLTAGEVAFFSSKGLSVPKRCKACREKKQNVSNLRKNRTPPVPKRCKAYREKKRQKVSESGCSVYLCWLLFLCWLCWLLKH